MTANLPFDNNSGAGNQNRDLLSQNVSVFSTENDEQRFSQSRLSQKNKKNNFLVVEDIEVGEDGQIVVNESKRMPESFLKKSKNFKNLKNDQGQDKSLEEVSAEFTNTKKSYASKSIDSNKLFQNSQKSGKLKNSTKQSQEPLDEDIQEYIDKIGANQRAYNRIYADHIPEEEKQENYPLMNNGALFGNLIQEMEHKRITEMQIKARKRQMNIMEKIAEEMEKNFKSEEERVNDLLAEVNKQIIFNDQDRRDAKEKLILQSIQGQVDQDIQKLRNNMQASNLLELELDQLLKANNNLLDQNQKILKKKNLNPRIQIPGNEQQEEEVEMDPREQKTAKKKFREKKKVQSGRMGVTKRAKFGQKKPSKTLIKNKKQQKSALITITPPPPKLKAGNILEESIAEELMEVSRSQNNQKIENEAFFESQKSIPEEFVSSTQQRNRLRADNQSFFQDTHMTIPEELGNSSMNSSTKHKFF